MAEISSFPNNSDIYQGAEEVMRWLHGRTSGVYAGAGNAAVSAVENTMQIEVAPGIGWIVDAAANGVCWWFDDTITLEIDQAEATGTLNRIDRVIVEWQTTDYAALPEVKILKGTNAGTAVPPSLTNSGTIRQLSLAQISIPAGTTALSALNIIDERMDPDVCGIVTETVTADTSMIAAQYDEAIAELLAAIAQAWEGEISDGSITRAKLAPSLLDEIGVSSVNTKTGAVVLDPDDVGAMAEWKLLWTNASPTSSFAAQTIPIDLTNYDAVLVIFRLNNNSDIHVSSVCKKGNRAELVAVHAAKLIARNIGSSGNQGVSDTGVEFTGGIYVNTYGTETSDNARCIPAYIYGIKGVVSA